MPKSNIDFPLLNQDQINELSKLVQTDITQLVSQKCHSILSTVALVNNNTIGITATIENDPHPEFNDYLWAHATLEAEIKNIDDNTCIDREWKQIVNILKNLDEEIKSSIAFLQKGYEPKLMSRSLIETSSDISKCIKIEKGIYKVSIDGKYNKQNTTLCIKIKTITGNQI